MVFINDTQTFASIYNGLTVNITGSEYMTLIIILMVVFALFFSFNFRVEWALIFMLPLLFVSVAYIGMIKGLLFVAILILALVLKENFL